MRRTEVVVRPDGLIAASGYLTPQGADLVRGTADRLRDSGHSRVVVDLRGVRSTDDAGLDILHQLRRDFAADGGELLIRGWTAGSSGGRGPMPQDVVRRRRAEGVGFEPTMGVTP